MKKKFWQIRIPTGAALIFLLFGIGVTSYLVQTGVVVIGRAAPDKTPANVIISNITSKSFVVAFTTNSESVAGITVQSPGSNPTTFFDQRNSSGQNVGYLSHRIIANNLKPDTVYRITVISGGESYLNGGIPYETKTAPSSKKTSTLKGKVSGIAIMPDSQPATDTLVELRIPGAEKMTTLTDKSGNYSFSLNGILTSNLKNYIKPKPSTIITLKFYRQDLTSEIKSTLSSSSKLPSTTLSYKYDFSKTAEIQEASGSSLFTLPAAGQTGQGAAGILIPSSGQYFVDTRPQFRGTGTASKNVSITISPGGVKGTTQVGTNGIWTFRPEQQLAAGSYTLKITTVDDFGISKSLSTDFGIFGTGSQIAGSGPTPTPTPRPSITVAPTNTPTPRPTSTPVPTTAALQTSPTTSVPTPASSPTPTLSALQPTPTLIAIAPSSTPFPTVIPTSNQTTPPSITPEPPGAMSTVLLSLISVVLIAGGAALLFIL